MTAESEKLRTYFYIMRKHVSRNKYTPKRDEGNPAWRRTQKARAIACA